MKLTTVMRECISVNVTKYSLPCRDFVGALPHTSVMIRSPTFSYFVGEDLGKGFVTSFPLMHASQVYSLLEVLLIRNSSGFAFTSFSRAFWCVCPKIRCSLSQVISSGAARSAETGGNFMGILYNPFPDVVGFAAIPKIL